MTIEKGHDWGTSGGLAEGAPIADTDAELADLIAEGRLGEAGLIGGDLARTLGARGARSEVACGTDRTRLPIDVGEVIIDDAAHLFVAHLVVRGPLWGGQVTAVMNAAFHGDWNLSPRSHPNDGWFDQLSGALSVPDRLKARSRLRSGTHVPHPGIASRRVRDGVIECGGRSRVYVDGRRVSASERIRFRLRPDEFVVVI